MVLYITFSNKLKIYRKYTIWYIISNLDHVKIINHNQKLDKGINTIWWRWQDSTVKDKLKLPKNSLSQTPTVINGRYPNISKKRLAKHFLQVFGYPYEIDPTIYTGAYIVKSNLNAQHDGVILATPLTKERYKNLRRQNKVFQKYIDARVADNDDPYRIHYRVPVFLEIEKSHTETNTWNQIPVVYRAKVHKQNHFKPINAMTELCTAETVFSSEEVTKILNLVRSLKIDYCELDILRDLHDQQIYVIDANDTPTITVNGYSTDDFAKGIKLQTDTFREWIKQFFMEISDDLHYKRDLL